MQFSGCLMYNPGLKPSSSYSAFDIFDKSIVVQSFSPVRLTISPNTSATGLCVAFDHKSNNKNNVFQILDFYWVLILNDTE